MKVLVLDEIFLIKILSGLFLLPSGFYKGEYFLCRKQL